MVGVGGEFGGLLRVTSVPHSCCLPDAVQGTPFALGLLNDESPWRTWGSKANRGPQATRPILLVSRIGSQFLWEADSIGDRAIGTTSREKAWRRRTGSWTAMQSPKKASAYPFGQL